MNFRAACITASHKSENYRDAFYLVYRLKDYSGDNGYAVEPVAEYHAAKNREGARVIFRQGNLLWKHEDIIGS